MAGVDGACGKMHEKTGWAMLTPPLQNKMFSKAASPFLKTGEERDYHSMLLPYLSNKINEFLLSWNSAYL